MSRQRKRKREKEKEKTFGEGWDLFCGGEDKQRRKRRKIIGRKTFLGEGKGGNYIFLWRRRTKGKIVVHGWMG